MSVMDVTKYLASNAHPGAWQRALQTTATLHPAASACSRPAVDRQACRTAVPHNQLHPPPSLQCLPAVSNSVILAMCGKDATAAFNRAHRGGATGAAAAQQQRYRIGALAG